MSILTRCLVVVAFLVLLPLSTFANEWERGLILADGVNNKFFLLMPQREQDSKVSFSWHELDDVEMEALSRLPERLFHKGVVKISEDGRQVFRRDVKSRWVKIPVSPEPGTTFGRAMVDGAGNLYLQYAGGGDFGIAYVSADLQDVVPRITSGREVPDAKTIIAAPGPSGGLVQLGHDGSLWGWLVPKSKAEPFSTIRLAPEGTFESVAEAHGSIFVVYGGKPAQLTKEMKLRILTPPWQQGTEVPGDIMVASIEDFRPGHSPKLPPMTWPGKPERMGPLQLPPGPNEVSGTPGTGAGKNDADFSRALDTNDEEAFYKNLEQLRQKLREIVVDQPAYTDAMVDLWRDVLSGTSAKDSHKVLLATGITGAGKTFGAKAFARLVLGSEERVLEIDGTQFQAHAGSLDSHRLVGGARGLQGSEFKGLLPEFLMKKGKGRNIIIINEFEHAAPWFHQMFKEVFDTGKVQGGDGVTYELGQSIIILTSNKGSDKIYPRGRKGALKREEIQARLAKITDKQIRDLFLETNPNDMFDKSKSFDPSILQRVDRAVALGPVSFEGALVIATREAERLAEARLSKKNGYAVTFDPGVIEHIVKNFYVPEDGARAIEKAVRQIFGDVVEKAQKQLKVPAGAIVNVVFEKGPDGETEQFKVERSDTKDELIIPAPVDPTDVRRKLRSPEFRESLKSLETRIGRHVFGQPDAIKMAAKAIRSHVVNPQLKEPAAMLLLGATGTGKTELAKAIAREEFGDETRMERFDMGKVKNNHDLANIFAPPKGVIGSSSMGRFEQVLNDFSEGAVLVFDEIGNMGGNSGASESKESLLKIFYDMLQEGEWVSPSGKRYDLRKFRLVFTSNEGQEFTQGMPSDDLRLAAWEAANKKEVLGEMLVKQFGWPEAFVGRFKGNMTLMRPIVASVRRDIAKKLVGNATRGLIEEHGLGGIKATDAFYDAVGESFFSHSRGARSIQGMAENALTDLIGEAILEAYERGSPRKSVVELELTDNFTGKYKYSTPLPPKREVILTVRLVSPDAANPEDASKAFTKEYKVDLASDASEKRLQATREIRRTAFHEAGHVIANNPEQTRQRIDYVTIRSAGDYGGYARYKDLTPLTYLTRASAVAILARALGGHEAERLMGFENASGWSNDLETARKIAEQAVTNYGITDKSLALPVSGGKVHVGDPRVQAEIMQLLADGEAMARARIMENWIQFRLVAAKLLRNGDFDAATYDRLMEATRSEEYLGRYARRKTQKNLQPLSDACQSLLERR